ncbi:MAG: TasA family protein, partial [Patescibacteria group bacterium]
MKKIITSVGMIVFIGALVAGGTGAFFSDTETSTANVFTAGAIDLKVDNESYYNGVLNTATTWTQTDLTIEKFFNFMD